MRRRGSVLARWKKVVSEGEAARRPAGSLPMRIPGEVKGAEGLFDALPEHQRCGRLGTRGASGRIGDAPAVVIGAARPSKHREPQVGVGG
jgi:hypothetical protein